MIKNIEKLDLEITRMKNKIIDYTNRLRDLERWKREAENAEIVAAVRGVELAPDALRAFIEAYKQQNTDTETASGKEQNEI